MNFKNALMYLLDFEQYNIEELVGAVLQDSDTDPHYSAVTTANLIKCYIKVMQELEEDFYCSDIENYFLKNQYTTEEYKLFMEKYNRESTVYHSQIF